MDSSTEVRPPEPGGEGRRRRDETDRRYLRSRLWLLLFSLGGLAIIAIALIQGTSRVEAHGRDAFGAILEFLEAQPFILVFLVVAVGYALGRLKLFGIGLGATGATLLVGLVISVWAVARHGVQFDLSAFASTIFFNLYMFAVGMKVGPQFISGLRSNAMRYIVLALFVPMVSLGVMLAFAAVVDLPPGVGPGIFAGANTATPGLGSAQTAFNTGTAPLPAGVSRETALGNLSMAFAFSYCISMVLFIVAIKSVPRLLRRDLAAEARSYEAAIRVSEPLPGSPGLLTGKVEATTRTYRVENPELFGKSLGELRRLAPLVAIEHVKRGARVLAPDDDVVLGPGDVVSVFGRVERVLAAAPRVGPEVDVPELRGRPPETVEVVVQERAVDGKTLLELATDVGHGFVLNALFRAGELVPVGPATLVRVGDVLRLTASPERIARLERRLGSVVRPSMSTDIVTLAVGLMLGAFLGGIAVPVGNIQLTLSSSVGLLLVGIALSTLRTRNPALGGPFPEPARQLLEDLGLNVFVAILGIKSGMGVVAAVEAGALGPIIAGCLLAGFVPPFLAWAIGQYGMKMNGALLVGCVAGARCNSAGMRAGQEASQSSVPAISYPVAFAISNVLCTCMAYLMVFII